MAITCIPRKITLAEQQRLRRDGQWSELLCVVDPSPTMWTAVMDATKPPAGNDAVYQVAFTSGAFTSPYTYINQFYVGATVLVGTTAGAHDLGRARLRLTTNMQLSAGSLRVGETSDVQWLSGEASTGTGTVTLNGTTAVVGSGTAFTTQLAAGKVIVCGGEARVVATITDNTHLTVSAAFTVSASAQAFTYYAAQAAVYITVIDEFVIWPRDLRTVGPTDSATLAGLVKCSANTLKVYGDVAATGYTYVDDSTSTTLVRSLPLIGSDAGFTTLFAVGDSVEVTWSGSIKETRVVVSIPDDGHMVVDAAFTRSGSTKYHDARAIKTRFLSDVHAGNDLHIGAATRTVVRVVNDRELDVSEVWSADVIHATFYVTILDIFMDYDRALDLSSDDANAHYLRPTPLVPNIGAPIVVEQQGSNPVVVQLGSAAWGFDADHADDQRVGGFTYSWRTPVGTLSSTSAATPTLTLTTPGVYRVSCALLPSPAGESWVGYQKIYVIGDTVSNADPLRVTRLTSCGGDDTNGWAAALTVYGADAALIRDRAQAVIITRDHYGDSTQYSDALTPIAQVTNNANIVMAGWITGDSIRFDAELSEASFKIEGPLYWLARITGLPTAFEHVTYAPGLWSQMYHLTVDRALWHLLSWRTTLTTLTDVYLTGDLRRLSFLEGKAGSIAAQIQQIATQSLLARLTSDRYGRVFVEINPQYVPSDARTTPVVQQLDTCDIINPLTLQTRSTNTVNKLVASGVAFDGTTATAIIATVPGNVRTTHGTPEAVPNLALVDQAQANRLAQLLIANRNNPYPAVSIGLAATNRLLDVAPAMYVTLEVPAALNPRNVALHDFPVLVKRVAHAYDPATGVLSTTIDGEGYTDETTRITNAPPQLAFSF